MIPSIVPIILANIDPAELGAWLKVAAYLLGMAVAVLLIVRHFKPSPAEFVPVVEALRKEMKEEDNALHGRISGIRNEVATKLDEIDRRNEERMNSFCACITNLGTDLGARMGSMESSVGHLAATSSRTESRLDRLIERTPKSNQQGSQ